MVKPKLVIVGDGETAEIAYEYFTYDSKYQVVAFSVEKAYRKHDTLFKLPVVPFEDLEKFYSPKKYELYIAISYTELNKVRTRLYKQAKAKGYKLASYVSSKAFVWHNVEIGENCFIFENNTLQYHVKIGNNVTLWSGNHIGHRTVIKDNTFVSSHVTVSGYCEIGESCFIGVNSTLVGAVKIADDCVIGAGAVVLHNTFRGLVYVGNPAHPLKDKTSFESFNVKEESTANNLAEQKIVSKALT
jgi:sugar O-acyltransferase (sialic acid O-acetyltransferase NeuD family)